jgi:hypothetical protein
MVVTEIRCTVQGGPDLSGSAKGKVVVSCESGVVNGPAATIICPRSARLLTGVVTVRSQLHIKPHLRPHIISPTFTAFRL